MSTWVSTGYRWLRVVAALSGLVAIISFAITSYADYKLRSETEARRFKEALVYKLVFEAEPRGIGFTELIQKYSKEAIKDSSIGKDDLSESELRRILIDLIQKSSIGLWSDDQYRLSRLPYGQLRGDQRGLVAELINNAISEKVVNEPYNYDIRGLANIALDRLKIDPSGRFNNIGFSYVIALQVSGAMCARPDGKLWMKRSVIEGPMCMQALD